MLKLGMLQKEERRELYHELSKEFSRQKDPMPGLREAKLKAVAGILTLMSDFSTPNQRQILDFTRETIMKATKNFCRDSAYESPQLKQGRSLKKHTKTKAKET